MSTSTLDLAFIAYTTKVIPADFVYTLFALAFPFLIVYIFFKISTGK